MKMDEKISVRWMTRRDMSDVLKIEKKNNGNLGWEENDFLHALKQRNCVGLVATVEEQVAGFFIYYSEKKYFEIANFSVKQKHVLLGIGEVFINRLKMKLATQRKKSLVVNVRETNLYTQLFLRDLGFKAVKVVRNYYDTEDAYRFIYKELNVKIDQ